MAQPIRHSCLHGTHFRLLLSQRIQWSWPPYTRCALYWTSSGTRANGKGCPDACTSAKSIDCNIMDIVSYALGPIRLMQIISLPVLLYLLITPHCCHLTSTSLFFAVLVLPAVYNSKNPHCLSGTPLLHCEQTISILRVKSLHRCMQQLEALGLQDLAF